MVLLAYLVMVALIGRSQRALPRAATDFEFLYLEEFSKKVDHHQIASKLYHSIRLVELSKNMYNLWGLARVDFFLYLENFSFFSVNSWSHSGAGSTR